MYDWENVPADTVICDVGGGNGHATLGLMKQFPKLKVVLQDLPAVIKQGKDVRAAFITTRENGRAMHLMTALSTGLQSTRKQSRRSAFNLQSLTSLQDSLYPIVIYTM